MADFTDAKLGRTDFTNSFLRTADFTRAKLWGANFSGFDLRNINFSGANLEGADLSGADIRDSSFEDARLHETFLDDARCNAETDFRAVHAYDAPELQPADADTWLARRKLDLQLARHYLTPARWRDTDTNPDKAVRVHRKLQMLLRENALPGEVPHHYVREKHARRRQAIVEGEYLKWWYAALQRLVMGYGERPWRVVATSLAVIVGFGLVYPFLGGMEAAEGETEAFQLAEALSLPLGEGTARVFFENLYFSAVTFSTLGYGDIQPGSETVQLLASVQSLLGALLMALLVAVLARRITR